MRELGLFCPVRESVEEGLPVFGTCAGLLLLAKSIENDEREHLATMDIHAVGNAYGRQLVTAFHPELTGDSRVHAYFLDMVAGR